MDSSLIFRNYPINSDSIEFDSSSEFQTGGNLDKQLKDIPHGGFPPISPCKEEFEESGENESDKEKRGYSSTNTNIVSIQNILEKRRKIIPFIPK